jgi:hypothetical protein
VVHLTRPKLGSSCKAGSFSLGGGKRWDNWPSNGLPVPFKTYCRPRSDDSPAAPDNCKGWKGSGETSLLGSMLKGFMGSGLLLDSGETGDGMESVLELHVEIVTAGRVVYVHRVDAEVPYDGLYALLLSLLSCISVTISPCTSKSTARPSVLSSRMSTSSK